MTTGPAKERQRQRGKGSGKKDDPVHTAATSTSSSSQATAQPTDHSALWAVSERAWREQKAVAPKVMPGRPRKQQLDAPAPSSTKAKAPKTESVGVPRAAMIADPSAKA